MDEAFGPAVVAAYCGDLDTLGDLLLAEPGLATLESGVGHRTLLQFVACEASSLPDPVGVTEMLVEVGASVEVPLVSAAGCGNQSVLETLLDSGADIDGNGGSWSPLDEALYWDNRTIADWLVFRGAAPRALSTAAALGDLDAISGFIDSGRPTPEAGPIGSPFPDTIPDGFASDPHSVVNHAFVMSVNTGERKAAELLVDLGAEVNAKPPGFHWHGTALHAAVWRGNRSLVEWLLDLGADPTIRDGLADSDAPGWARHHDHPDLIALLVSNKA